MGSLTHLKYIVYCVVCCVQIHLYSDGGIDISADGRTLFTCALLLAAPRSPRGLRRSRKFTSVLGANNPLSPSSPSALRDESDGEEDGEDEEGYVGGLHTPVRRAGEAAAAPGGYNTPPALVPSAAASVSFGEQFSFGEQSLLASLPLPQAPSGQSSLSEQGVASFGDSLGMSSSLSASLSASLSSSSSTLPPPRRGSSRPAGDPSHAPLSLEVPMDLVLEEGVPGPPAPREPRSTLLGSTEALAGTTTQPSRPRARVRPRGKDLVFSDPLRNLSLLNKGNLRRLLINTYATVDVQYPQLSPTD